MQEQRHKGSGGLTEQLCSSGVKPLKYLSDDQCFRIHCFLKSLSCLQSDMQMPVGQHRVYFPLAEVVNLSQFRMVQSPVARNLSRKKGSTPISCQVPHSKESSEIEKVMKKLPAVEQMQREGQVLGCSCSQVLPVT